MNTFGIVGQLLKKEFKKSNAGTEYVKGLVKGAQNYKKEDQIFEFTAFGNSAKSLIEIQENSTVCLSGTLDAKESQDGGRYFVNLVVTQVTEI